MTYLEIALIVSLAISLLALILAIISLKATRRQADSTEKLLQKLARDLAASTSGSVGMGQRLLAMENVCKQRKNNQKKLTFTTTMSFNLTHKLRNFFKWVWMQKKLLAAAVYHVQKLHCLR